MRRGLQPCGHYGCRELVRAAHCEAHAATQRAEIQQRKGTAASRGYGSRWRKARAAYLAVNPLCVMCSPRVVAANVVDHIQPVNQGGAMWDQDNWQPLCTHCHSSTKQIQDRKRPSSA